MFVVSLNTANLTSSGVRQLSPHRGVCQEEVEKDFSHADAEPRRHGSDLPRPHHIHVRGTADHHRVGSIYA